MFDIDQSKSIANTVIFAIGDVHGRYDLLSSIHEILDDQLSTFNEPSQGLVLHLADLIDRGPDSIPCLLSALNWRHEGCESIVLPGNHEQMLLSFWESVSNCKNIVEQQQSLDLWLQCGGDAVCDELNVYDNDDIDEIIIALDRAGVPAMLKKLSTSPTAVRSGQYLFVHAGIPCKPNTGGREFMHPDDVPGIDWRSENINSPFFEERNSPLWVREPFLSYTAAWPDDVIVVHGHTINLERPEIMHNRMGIDTGACIDGSLTMLKIKGGETTSHSVSASHI